MNTAWIEEYPRPQLKRNSFYSLNGEWLLNHYPIIVPFAPESQLSLYHHTIQNQLHYQKTFVLPDHFYTDQDCVILHFGAVDQIATVYLNGQMIGQHVGGYLPFSFQITDALVAGENHLVVDVIDKLSHVYPYGKQRKDRGGMWYTPISGIWQSVWIEAVPDNSIQDIKIKPTLSTIDLDVTTQALHYSVIIPELEFKQTYQQKHIHIDLSSYELQLWDVNHPHLYTFYIETDTDRVESYFALRTIEIKKVNQYERIYLNHKPLFLHGVLDQGYYHDGIYLPHNPLEYQKDVLRMKELGMNVLRKHIKIEPETFYYACDRLGMLVIQAMVNNGSYHWFFDTALPNAGFLYRPDYFAGNKKQRDFFQNHMLETLDHLYNHPCIIAYTIFNEGWGQFKANQMYRLCRKKDDTRLYDATSGWFHQHESDFESLHVYFKNKCLKSHQQRPLFLSECGGYTRAIEGHIFNQEKQYGYGSTNSEKALTDKIIQLYEEMVIPSINYGLCGCIYTQLSDVEDEINGLYTYDREICKVDKIKMKILAQWIQGMIKDVE